MMIKIANEVLDFDGSIEVDKQIKLIEEIATSDGDFSYDFEIPKTLHNTRLLGNPQPDNVSKRVYQRVDARLLNDSGAILYNGFIRIERISDVYHCSFFSGNNNWFSLLTGTLTDLDLSTYDIEITEANIQASKGNTDGVTFPLIDNGTLLGRSYRHLKVEDFLPGIYVKTIFYKIFSQLGIKLQGELFNDWIFNNAIILSGPNKDEIKRRTTYAGKLDSQPITVIGEDPPQILKVEWDTVTQYPYFDGTQGNFDIALDRYTADVKMSVEVDVSIEHQSYAVTELWIYKNGVIYTMIAKTYPETLNWISTQGKTRIDLVAGDYIEVYVNVSLPVPVTVDMPITGGYFKITPVFIYQFTAAGFLPSWTKQQFVSNILRIFNCLPSYNKNSGTLTVNLFEKIKYKEAIDLSEYITGVETDYADFISNYGQKSLLSYNEVQYPELANYDIKSFYRYGQGVINVNNDFLEETTDIIESDFSHPMAYINSTFGNSMERVNLLELDEGDSFEFENVLEGTDGLARFYLVDGAVPTETLKEGDLIRIDEQLIRTYNGDWIIYDIGIVDDYVDWIELRGLSYSSDIAGSVQKLDHVYTMNDEVFILINVPNAYVADISPFEFYYLGDTAYNNFAFAYFDLLDTFEPINDNFLYSLSFGGNNDDRQYQVTMTERYFSLLRRVLNDPVNLRVTAQLPIQVYNAIDFLQPVTIKTLETTNRYYVNKISGYKESYLDCEIELIKLP